MFVRVMIRRRVMIFYSRTWPCPIDIGIRVNIGGAIGPDAAPGNSPMIMACVPEAKPGLAQPKGTNAGPINMLGHEMDGEADRDPRSRWS
jgi:hypothetical protein